MDLDLGDPGAGDRVDDLLRMDGDTTIEEEQEGDESGMSLVGEGMCGDGAAALEELRQQYEVIDKQNEVGKEESMSVASGSSIGGASISIGGGNKRPSPESNSGVEGASEVKKTKRERRGFTRVEKEILEERFNKTQLDDKKGREEVAALLSSSGKPLSSEQVRIWVDNFKASLKKKKDGKDNQSAPNDKE
jgi:hypothetical protein